MTLEEQTEYIINKAKEYGMEYKEGETALSMTYIIELIQRIENTMFYPQVEGVTPMIVNPQPCNDAVNRMDVISIVQDIDMKSDVYEALRLLKELPSVQLERPKGHWIEHPHECGMNWDFSKYECSECHGWTEDDSDFCPNCGCQMNKE